MTGQHPAAELAEVIADRLAHPDGITEPLGSRPWWRQSLAHGAPGIALLHIERAAAGRGPWQRAHDWLEFTARAPLTSGADSHLFYGAPALAHALACAASQRLGSYDRALDSLDRAITDDARRLVESAHTRIDANHLPALAEFDVIRGLSGIGSYLLRRDPGGRALHAVLEYLVRLTEPIILGGETLPGWWTASGPDGRAHHRFAGGHGNLGLAHGIGGPLALLALAARNNITVDGHADAIARICAWLDQWRIHTPTGPVWPYWINRSHLRAGRRDHSGPQRPGWCYGTAGLARAQQLAALATGDSRRRAMAESALVQALADPAQRAATDDASLCHGYAGLAHIAVRAATEAEPEIAERLLALVPDLLTLVQPADAHPDRTVASLLDSTECGPAFLEGAAGVALAVLALIPTTSLPRSGWDTCLLIA